MSVKEDKNGTEKTWRQVGPSESRILLVIVIVSAVIILCSVWHLCWQKDKDPYFTDTVLVEHTVVFDTLRVNVSINQGDEVSLSGGGLKNEKNE